MNRCVCGKTIVFKDLRRRNRASSTPVLLVTHQPDLTSGNTTHAEPTQNQCKKDR